MRKARCSVWRESLAGILALKAVHAIIILVARFCSGSTMSHMAERSSRRFHQETKDVLGGPPVPADLELWPESWLTIEYKTYPRLPKIELPQTAPSADFFDIVKKRSSKRTVSGGSVKLEALSSILRYSCGIVSREGGMHRAQPSAGTRFPLEVYSLVLHGSDALPSGISNYGVRENMLDVLW